MKARIKQQDFKTYTEQALSIFEVCTLVALNEYAGWGNKRLGDYIEVLHSVCKEYEHDLCCTDVEGGSKGTGLSFAIQRLVRAADSRNIDWRELLGIDVMGTNGLPIRRNENGNNTDTD